VSNSENKSSGFKETEQSLLLPPLELKVSPEALAEIQALYHEAFRLYGSQALWNVRHRDSPTAETALVITRALRTYAGMPGRRLAERIEALCHAVD